ncbi:unnamed protein product [Colias eurytheme]|nr:unnamed protein product [Colias eurytheme]
MYKTPPKNSPNQQSSRTDSDSCRLITEDGHSSEPSATNITQRAKRRRPNDHHNDQMNELRIDLNNMIRELINSQNTRLDKLETLITDIKTQYAKIVETNTEIEKSVTYISDQLTELESKISGLEALRTDMEKKISSLEEKIEALERHSIKTCVELRNVPKIPQENKVLSTQPYSI